MSNILKNIILFPLSWLYGIATNIRNWLYDNGLLPSTSFKKPIIVIGNLAVGGTGKTPHVEYVAEILSKDHNTAILSRGYKRKTTGFLIADEKANSQTIGDEPYQMYRKTKKTTVAVCEDRVNGINKLLKREPNTEVIILDDGFQHRKLKPGLTILLTDYHNLYSKDYLLPAGTLRESTFNSIRADIIIVTKCPKDIKPIDMRVIETELNPKAFQSLFFSQIAYDEIQTVCSEQDQEEWMLTKIKDLNASILLVTGIASPKEMIDYLETYTDKIQKLTFPDHHHFGKQDAKKIESKFESIADENKLIICTEKDAARIISNTYFCEELKQQIYYLPIHISIIKQEKLLTQKITNYVAENTRNSQFPKV